MKYNIFTISTMQFLSFFVLNLICQLCTYLPSINEVWGKVISGRSRISPGGGGAPTPRGGGGSTYEFAKFSQKLHEIERIWMPGGGGGAPLPKSANGNGFTPAILFTGGLPSHNAMRQVNLPL